jgi:predicted nucleotide-binding protein (sugar kinase/HSP70/actin superfamily)
MRVTFPHMGNLAITAKTVLEGLGLEVVVPPPCTKKTMSLGVLHSPEFACLPLKINLGNYLEAMELGADTAIMAGGIGPCRIGYYAQVQQEILQDLGAKLKIVVLEPPDAHLKEVWDEIASLNRNPWPKILAGLNLAWQKTRALDLLELKVHQIRPRETVPGAADEVFRQACGKIDSAHEGKKVRRILSSSTAAMEQIPQKDQYFPIKIALVGEIYTVLEPFVNLNLEKHLGTMGVEVVRSLYLSGWINEHLLGGLLRINGTKKARKLAAPFINSFVGGHGRESVGSAVEYARQGVDGIIQIAPLTCMPEIVAHSVLPAVGSHYGLPILTIYVDEQTGEAGLLTRLEAFIDMIKRRKLRKKKVVK